MALIAMLLPPALAARDGNVFELTLSETISYDDNLYRLAPDANATQLIGTERRDDLASSTTLGLSADKPFGRQNLYGSYRHIFTRYQIHKNANYELDDGQLGWKGGFGRANQWDLYAKRTAAQSDYADNPGRVANTATTDIGHAEMDLRYASDWRSRFVYEASRLRNSTAVSNGGDYDGYLASMSLGVWPASGNGLEARYANSGQDYAKGQTYKQHDFGLNAAYGDNPASRFEGSAGVQIQKAGSNRETRRGRLSLRHTWRPRGSSTLSLRVLREKTSPSTSSPVQAESYGGEAQWTWLATAKLRFDSSIDYRKRHYDPYQEFSGAAPIDRREYLRTASIALNYFLQENLVLALSTRNDKRDANHIRYNYDSQSYSLTLQYVY
ncbi:hypothetical protein GCM10025770_31890 [Viridibacterium curvum]|uniref:Outer membrane beta-barrel protein n=2 Tax=Viridibacterium curvum TaxID=1101404 RepID=A0ABP9QZU3_9RHOO